MGTRQTDTVTQTLTKISKPPKCAICYKVIAEVQSCDWNQGRCPHAPSIIGQIMSSPYKARFYNLIKFFKGRR
jgi:hypothetical protein